MVFKSVKRDKDDRRGEEVYPIPSATPKEPVSKPSYIGETMTMEGEISSDEDVIIEGKVEGNISVGKVLTIGKNGKVKAGIKAAVVRIIGEAQGNIVASDKVEILVHGRYTGSIQSQKLVVAEGAILNGNINQGNPDN